MFLHVTLQYHVLGHVTKMLPLIMFIKIRQVHFREASSEPRQIQRNIAIEDHLYFAGRFLG